MYNKATKKKRQKATKTKNELIVKAEKLTERKIPETTGRKKIQRIIQNSQLGQNLRIARMSKGLKQSEIQRKTGGKVQSAMISNYELGENQIPAIALKILADVYEKPIKWFFVKH